MKIAHKLTLTFLVIALIIGFLGYIVVVTSKNVLQQTIGENSVYLVANILDKIDRHIYGKIETIQVCTQDLILQRALLKSNREFDNLQNAQAYIDNRDQEWVSTPKKEITPFMQELMNNRLANELIEKIEFYKDKYGYSVFAEIFATNKYGANVAQTGRTSDYRQDDELWWKNGKRDTLFVADVNYDESADVYSLDISVRINDENGDFAGVLKAVMNITEIVSVVEEAEALSKYKTVEFKLFTKDIKLIYSTEEFEFLEDLSEGIFSRFREGGKHIKSFIAEGDNPGESEELFAHAHSRGYNDFKGLGWILVGEYETREIFAPVAGLKKFIVAVSLALTGLALLIGLLVSRTVSRPLGKLQNAMVDVSKGNLDSRIDVASNDEIGKLAASFTRMVEDLQKTTVSKDYMDNIIGNMPDMLIVIDTSGRIKTVNPATLRLLKYQEDELIGKPIEMVFVEEELLFKESGLQKLMEMGSIDNVEKTYRTKDGGRMPVSFSSSIMSREHGNIQGIVCMAQDITERKMAEDNLKAVNQQLAASEQQQKSINRNLHERMKELNCLYGVSRLVEEGKSLDEILQIAVELLPPAWRYPETTCAKIVCNGKKYSSQNYTEAKWKQTADIIVSGKIAGVIEIACLEQKPEIDEGPFSKEERALIDALARKLSIIIERNQAVEAVKQKNKEILDLTGAVTHDLKKPLATIKTICSLVASENVCTLNEDGIEAIAMGMDAIQYMQELLEDLLACAKLEAGAHSLEMEEIDVEEVVETVLQRLKFQVQEKNITITHNINNVNEHLHVDKKGITKVFMNLIGNAISYIGEKPEPEIVISVSESRRGSEYQFSVKDNGLGIPEEMQTSIFQKFKRGANVSGISGTGLGLSIVKGVIEAHQGEIWLESEEGEGTIFYFTLPKI